MSTRSGREVAAGWSTVIVTRSTWSKLDRGPVVLRTSVIRLSFRSNVTFGSFTTGTLAPRSKEMSFVRGTPGGVPGKLYCGSVTSTLGSSSSAKRTGPQAERAKSSEAVERTRARMVASLSEVEEESELHRRDRRAELGVGDPDGDGLAAARAGHLRDAVDRRPAVREPGAGEEDEALGGADLDPDLSVRVAVAHLLQERPQLGGEAGAPGRETAH